MEETKKKGLSKGCIIGIVIASVLIVLVVGGGILCYANKDALIKMGMSSVVSSVKIQLEENPIEGFDNETYNAIADRFLEKLDADEELDPEKMQAFALQMQAVGQSMENLSASDVSNFMQAMVDYYPELKEYLPAEEITGDETEEGTEEGSGADPAIE